MHAHSQTVTKTTIQFVGVPRPGDPSPLVGRLADVEVPAAGAWTLVPASHVAIAPSADARPVEIAVRGGLLISTPTIEEGTLHLALGPDGATMYTGTPVRVVATTFGLVEWSIEGVLTDDRGTVPMTLTLGYHGVYRQARRAWAWFTGSGQVDRAAVTPSATAGCEVVVDLLFEAPPHLSNSGLGAR